VLGVASAAMRSTCFVILGALMILRSACEPAAASPDPMLHAAAGAVVDAAGDPVLLRCVNLSPWLDPEGYLIAGGSLAALTTSPSQIKQRLQTVVGLERAAAFWREWIEAFVTEADFRRLKSAGFNCVRLPLDTNFIAGPADGDRVTFVRDMVAPVDRAVAWGAATGVYVILDLHDAPGGQNPLSSVSDVPSTDHTPRLWEGPSAAENQRRTILLWRALATRYAHARSVGGYDLLNEPALPSGAPRDALARLYAEVIAAIRSVDADHMIVIEGSGYAHDFSALQTLQDGNVLYEFHEYALANRTWRRPGESALAPWLALRQATGRPLWLGEFGENTAAWQAQVVSLLEAHRIGWAIWPWKRIAIGNHHPVIETIEAPASWRELADYLVGRWLARKPSQSEAEHAMGEMLIAVRTKNCRTDQSLVSTLAGH
jgi:endoglucanase